MPIFTAFPFNPGRSTSVPEPQRDKSTLFSAEHHAVFDKKVIFVKNNRMKLLFVDRVKEFSAELEEAFCRLLPQLSPRLAAPSEERMRQLLAHPTTALFIARAAEAVDEGAGEVTGEERTERFADEVTAGLTAGAAITAGPATTSGADVPAAHGRIVGVLTLVWYDAPSGRKAWIEDVVVDSAARGCGAGRALVEAAQCLAREIGADRLMLTSNPRRTAARALYRKCGFNEAETTVFVSNMDKG